MMKCWCYTHVVRPGTKRLVPRLQGEIITAAAVVALFWNLAS